MRSALCNFVALSCVVMLCCAHASMARDEATTQPLTEDQKIESLIRTVDELKDATFIRNGTEYNCHAAAKHMRDKWEYGRKHIKTASDFIELAASKSSTSGKPYHIR